MKKFLFFAAAVAALLTSCQKENGSDDSSAKGVKTITASISNNTKVVMGTDDGDETKLNWELGDNLFLMDQNGSTGKYSSLNAGETATFNLIDGDGVSSEGQHVAAYPYDGITIDTSDDYPTILFKYSDSQTYTENSFDKNAMPLLAMNETGTNFTFNAMAPVLRLNVKLATAISDVKVNSVVIESASRNLSGFSNWDGSCFYEPGESYGEVGPSITLNCGEGVPISTTATQFCMVIPANEDDVDSDIYPLGDLTITVKTNKGNIVKTSKAAATFVAGKVYNINVSGDPTPALPAGALPGLFSVSATKKVHFSQGNLTYNVSTTTWAFYEHQYDCATDYDSNLISLFTWGYGDWSTSPDGSDYQTGDFTDWGSQIGDGNTWRTLTTAEWQYLFNYRDYTSDVRNGKYKWATVNGVNGYVIAPDDFSGELANTYADDAALAANNLVFLPAAGTRVVSDVSLVGDNGYYWSSTARGGDAYFVALESSYVGPEYDGRNYGSSVRLITDEN